MATGESKDTLILYPKEANTNTPKMQHPGNSVRFAGICRMKVLHCVLIAIITPCFRYGNAV